MELPTTRFGRLETLEIPEESGLDFPHRLPGFESHQSFAPIEDPRSLPFRWLQRLVDPHVTCMVIDPALVVDQYKVYFAGLDADYLELIGRNAAEVYCILAVLEDARSATINLKAPIIVNRLGRRGKQVILTDERFPLRHRLLRSCPRMESAGARCSS